MFERLQVIIRSLKNATSLKYFDLSNREKAFNVLNELADQQNNMEIIQSYLLKMEQASQIMMEKISTFINQITENLLDAKHSYEQVERQLSELKRNSHDEANYLENCLKEMNEKLESRNFQIIRKQEQINDLVSKLDEKQMIIEHLEKQSQQFLRNFQGEFTKQQKALQQSYTTIKKLQEANYSLMQRQYDQPQQKDQTQSREEENNNMIYIQNERIVSQDQSEASQKEESDSCSIVKYSIISSTRSHQNIFDQFEEVKHMGSTSKDLQNSREMEFPIKGQTLKEILNVSIEKQYKMDYNKCDSVQQKHSKQNHPLNLLGVTKSRQRKYQWLYNNSAQQLLNEGDNGTHIKQFKLTNNLPAKKVPIIDPYLAFFQITTQNIKIKSQFFEQICSLSNEEHWKILKEHKIPLHEWDHQIKQFLYKKAGISLIR